MQGTSIISADKFTSNFGEKGLSEITGGQIQEYRIHRHNLVKEKTGKTSGKKHFASRNGCPKTSLKCALGTAGCRVCQTSAEPYRAQTKYLTSRALPDEYKQLIPPLAQGLNPKRKRYKWELSSYMTFLFCLWGNTACDRTKPLDYNIGTLWLLVATIQKKF